MRSLILAFALVLAIDTISVPVVSAAPASDPAAYPLGTCIVSGEPLGVKGKAVAIERDGRELLFCSKNCAKRFEKAPSSYLDKLDQAIIDDQIPHYPLATCVVTGEAFGGEMGKPANYLYKNRLVRFCCIGCRGAFDKEPASYLAKLDEAAISAQLKNYPSDVCPISGQKLGGMGDPYNHIFAGRLVRLCCKGCIDSFNGDPVVALTAVYGESQDDQDGSVKKKDPVKKDKPVKGGE